jgi:hypothetical protein
MAFRMRIIKWTWPNNVVNKVHKDLPAPVVRDFKNFDLSELDLDLSPSLLVETHASFIALKQLLDAHSGATFATLMRLSKGRIAHNVPDILLQILRIPEDSIVSGISNIKNVKSVIKNVLKKPKAKTKLNDLVRFTLLLTPGPKGLAAALKLSLIDFTNRRPSYVTGSLFKMTQTPTKWTDLKLLLNINGCETPIEIKFLFADEHFLEETANTHDEYKGTTENDSKTN